LSKLHSSCFKSDRAEGEGSYGWPSMIAELFSSSFLGLWLTKAGILQPPSAKDQAFSTFVLQPPDRDRDQIIHTYLDRLAQGGFASSQQGIWMQSDHELLVDHRGQHLQTPASLTKIATTLAMLKALDPHHVFKTKLYATSPIRNGVLNGDLILQAEGDPLLVTPEAIALGNQLNQLGLRRVTGNLVLQGAIAINFSKDLPTAGAELKHIWNAAGWTANIQQTHAAMPKGTPKPALTLEGEVIAGEPIMRSTTGTLLVSYPSLPLKDLLKYMNVYSNNSIAEWLPKLIGGTEGLRSTVLQTGRVVPKEIALTNGSGLGQDNKLSPRAVVGLLQAIQIELQPHHLSLADVFPIAGRDRGTVEQRKMPKSAVIKTGTLWNTSGLAGTISTQRYGPVWFAIMNQGEDYTDGFRNEQDALLKKLEKQWGAIASHQESAVLPKTSIPYPITPSDRQRLQSIDRFMQSDFLSH
jgi:serine-type D-Ala-D-Ala carboxypeptidase/endopeptidase (penicillin-binding protein 4)